MLERLHQPARRNNFEQRAEVRQAAVGEGVAIRGSRLRVGLDLHSEVPLEYSERHGGGSDDRSRVTWEIEPKGEVCKLTLIHDGWQRESKSYESAGEGWPMILSALKTLLETAEQLPLDLGAESQKAADH